MLSCVETPSQTTMPASASSVSTPSTFYTAATPGSIATLLRGMALGGAIGFAFVAILACAAFKRTRRLTMLHSQPVPLAASGEDALEAQVPYGSLSLVEDPRPGSAVLAPESLREKMLAGL